MTTRTQTLRFSSLGVLSIVFWWRSLVATFNLALANDAYTHILLVLPLTAALIYTDWKHSESKPFKTHPQSSTLIAAALILMALLLGAYARWGMAGAANDVRLSLDMFALVTCCLANVWFCFGAKTFRAFLFPLCFLFLIVPIPEFALNRIVEFLQNQSAFSARLMFRAAGVPATQDGVMIFIPGLDIEVAQECSSIRSSLMLLVTTMVLAHLFLRSWWRKALLIAAVIPLSVAKNGLRIFTIAELGTRVDRGFLTGNLHRNGGIVFFGVSVAAVAALLWALRRTEPPPPKD